MRERERPAVVVIIGNDSKIEAVFLKCFGSRTVSFNNQLTLLYTKDIRPRLNRANRTGVNAH